MTFKDVMGKIGRFFKKVGQGIYKGIKWVIFRLKQWVQRTKAKISRLYLVYACFISGIIGMVQSIKAQYRVWKDEREDYFNPVPIAPA
jgi:hypothetical protein